MTIARALQNACSDLCTSIEVWSGIRRVDAASIKAPSRRSVDEIVAQVHTTVLEREMVLRDSKWAIADSARLLAETQQLLDRQRFS